jgi:hypothetical protein
MTFLSIPALFRAPTNQLLLTEWRLLRSRGRSFAQPLSLLATTSYLLTAYLIHSPRAWPRTYKLLGAAAATFAIIPFRFLGMYGANVELLHREEESWDAEGEGRREEAEEVASKGDGVNGQKSVDIIRWWGRMNLVRAALPLVGSLLAFEAL